LLISLEFKKKNRKIEGKFRKTPRNVIATTKINKQTANAITGIQADIRRTKRANSWQNCEW